MASESTETRSVSLALPATLDEWLTERAESRGVDREELVVELVAAYRVAAGLEDGEGAAALAATLDDSEDVDLQSRVAEAVDERLDRRFDAFEDAREEKLDDIRRRVVQVKRATDEKAPADHDHEAFDRLDALADRLGSLSVAVDDLRDRLDAGERPGSAGVGAGADGRSVASRLDDVEDKLTRVARVVVGLDDRVEDVEAAVPAGATAPADDLARLRAIKRTAARAGVEAAECGACGETVDLTLLGEATCPHCETPVDALEPGDGDGSGDTEGGTRGPRLRSLAGHREPADE